MSNNLDWFDKIFWPHPFKGSSRPLQIATTGDTEKCFVMSYSEAKLAIVKHIEQGERELKARMRKSVAEAATTARIDELTFIKNCDPGQEGDLNDLIESRLAQLQQEGK